MTDTAAIAERIQSESRALDSVRAGLQQVIVGQEELIEGLLVAGGIAFGEVYR